ncbi:MAG: NAD-dependent epimerase/dehydratase family protein [archaeon]
MNVLVTGSGGFIGKELVKELKKEKHNTIEFDLSKGQNLLNPKDLDALKGAEIVIHLAALLDESKTLEELNTVNVKGTELLLEKCVEFKIKKFIYLSTVGVMGNITKQADENTSLNPQTKYEKTKAEAEKKVNEFQELIPITIIRSALVLGPNKYWKQITELIKKGFPLIGEGKNNFQVIYYKDLVSAILFCLKKAETENETFIVAEEKPKKLVNLYCLIQKELGIEKKIKVLPVFLARIYAFFKGSSILRNEYIQRLVRERNYSTEKINKLGWKAKYSTEDAVKETIKELNAKN